MAVGAAIEEVLFGFFRLETENASGGSYEASLVEVIPSQGSVVHH